nr:MAG TPA: hypothetical protein [Caudoviricetes sp.]
MSPLSLISRRALWSLAYLTYIQHFRILPLT